MQQQLQFIQETPSKILLIGTTIQYTLRPIWTRLVQFCLFNTHCDRFGRDWLTIERCEVDSVLEISLPWIWHHHLWSQQVDFEVVAPFLWLATPKDHHSEVDKRNILTLTMLGSQCPTYTDQLRSADLKGYCVIFRLKRSCKTDVSVSWKTLTNGEFMRYYDRSILAKRRLIRVRSNSRSFLVHSIVLTNQRVSVKIR